MDHLNPHLLPAKQSLRSLQQNLQPVLSPEPLPLFPLHTYQICSSDFSLNETACFNVFKRFRSSLQLLRLTPFQKRFRFLLFFWSFQYHFYFCNTSLSMQPFLSGLHGSEPAFLYRKNRNRWIAIRCFLCHLSPHPKHTGNVPWPTAHNHHRRHLR